MRKAAAMYVALNSGETGKIDVEKVMPVGDYSVKVTIPGGGSVTIPVDPKTYKKVFDARGDDLAPDFRAYAAKPTGKVVFQHGMN